MRRVINPAGNFYRLHFEPPSVLPIDAHFAVGEVNFRSTRIPEKGVFFRVDVFWGGYILFWRLPTIKPAMTQTIIIAAGIKVGSKTIGARNKATIPITTYAIPRVLYW